MARTLMSWSVLLLLCTTADIVAQPSPHQRGLQPVDPQVGDVDPLQRSLRRVEQGLGYQGQESSMYQQPGDADPGRDRLYYITRGVVAEFDRSQYLHLQTRNDGALVVQTIPPNTVFHIGPPPVKTPEPAPPDSPLRVDAMVSTRMAGTIEPPVSAARPGPRVHADGWREYHQLRRAQRDSVIAAIDRALAAPVDAQP